MARSYWIRTFGCQMNEHDSERLAGALEADGLVRAGDLETADVVVLNTCCIRENADNKLYGTLGHLKALKDRRPELEIAVGGCLAQKDGEDLLHRAPHVDVVFGTHNVGRAPELLRSARSSRGPVVEVLDAPPDDEVEFASELPVRRDVPYAAWLTIQIGCDNSCAFCIVPAVRGPEVSRAFGDVVDEARRAAADGVTEICLLGQNVNSYGRDLTLAERRRDDPSGAAHRVGPTWWSDRRARPLFADLLRAVGEVEGIRRVRFTSPHPKDLSGETIAAMAGTAAVCEQLHLPLQSGSDRILASMHRGYTAERYLDRLSTARRAVADLAVTTDVIVGFPGETDADFDATLEVVAAAQVDSAYTFVFSPRPGTEAAGLPEPVPHGVAVERMARLRDVVERSSRRRNEARVGRLEEVLVEGPSKRDPSMLSGRTRQNKLVHFPATGVRPGSYALVEVTAAALSSLSGELREVIAPARHRTRLAVSAV